jgi:Flp pilus assembly protein protease CpaA
VTLPLAVALAGSTASAFCDVRTGLVPNRLTYALAAAGVACLVGRAGGEMTDTAVTVGLAVAAAVPLYARGLLGGGDAKLLIALAALDGPALFWPAAFYSFAFGGAAAACLLIHERRVRHAFSADPGIKPLPFAAFVCAGQSVAMAATGW